MANAALPAIILVAGCSMFPERDFSVNPYSRIAVKGRVDRLSKETVTRMARELGRDPLKALTIGRCLEIAFSNNRSLRQLKSALSRTYLEGTIADATLLKPSLSASFSALDDSGSSRIELSYASKYGVEVEPFVGIEYDRDVTPSKQTRAGITLSRKLLNRAEHVRIRLPKTQAQLELLTAKNRYTRESRELRFDATRLFLTIQRAKARLKVRENRVKDTREFLRIIQNRVQHGFAAPVDEVNARINLNQAELDLVSEQTKVRNAKERLLDLLALDVTKDLEIRPMDVTKVPELKMDLESDIAVVMNFHERVLNQRLRLDYKEKEIRVQHDLLRPQNTLGFTSQVELQGDEFFGKKTDDDNFVLGFSYNTPLDGKREEKARLKQMQKEFHEQMLELRKTETELETRLRALYRRIAELNQRIRLSEERLRAEEKKLAATLRRYETGAVDNLEVTRAKQDLDDAQVRLLDARIDLYLAIAEYKSILPPTSKWGG